MKDKPPCDHLRVNIVRILRAISPRTGKSRIIGGHCDHCRGTVQREMNAKEIATGIPQTVWR